MRAGHQSPIHRPALTDKCLGADGIRPLGPLGSHLHHAISLVDPGASMPSSAARRNNPTPPLRRSRLRCRRVCAKSALASGAWRIASMRACSCAAWSGVPAVRTQTATEFRSADTAKKSPPRPESPCSIALESNSASATEALRATRSPRTPDSNRSTDSTTEPTKVGPASTAPRVSSHCNLFRTRIACTRLRLGLRLLL